MSLWLGAATELGYVARLKPEFDRRGVKAIGLSIDPMDSHAKRSDEHAEAKASSRTAGAR
jgi:alkyl hydroperoxide reductase subunit AhpC